MNNLSLSLYELIYLGIVLKRPIQAIPNTFNDLPQEDASEFRQAALDSLLAKGLITMDFDGELSISSEAQELLNICIECDGYYLLNLHKTDGSRTEEVIWRKGNAFLYAEVVDYEYAEYIFSPISAEEIRTKVESVIDCDITTACARTSIQLTQLILKKAKRAIRQNNKMLAINLLAQSGAQGELLSALLDALSGNANLITTACVDVKKSDPPVTHLISQYSNGYMEIVPIVDNYRSAALFLCSSSVTLKYQLTTEIHNFVKEIF